MAIAAALILALLALWFLLSARAIEIRTVPAEAELAIDGGGYLALGSRLLLRPGNYQLTVSAKGYATRQQQLLISKARDQQLDGGTGQAPRPAADHHRPGTRPGADRRRGCRIQQRRPAAA